MRRDWNMPSRIFRDPHNPVSTIQDHHRRRLLAFDLDVPSFIIVEPPPLRARWPDPGQQMNIYTRMLPTNAPARTSQNVSRPGQIALEILEKRLATHDPWYHIDETVSPSMLPYNKTPHNA